MAACATFACSGVSLTEMPRLRLLLPALATATLAASAPFAFPASGAIQSKTASRFARCPRVVKAEGKEAKTDMNPRAAEAMVPLIPSALRLCRYYGLGFNQTPQTQGRVGKLRDERILTKAAAVHSIAEEFDFLQEAPEGPIYCPDDEGARLYATFAYADRTEPKVPVEVHLSGCAFVSNGRAPVSRATPQLISRLKALTSGNS